MLSGLFARLRALVFRARTGADMDEELSLHFDAEVERNVAKGMSLHDATYAARRAFGNVTYHKEEMRDAIGVRWLEHAMQDVRFALRTFRRAPTFAVTVVATIALALGLNTTAFTIFNAYVLRPIHVRDPYSLYQMSYHDRHDRFHSLTLDAYRQLRDLRGRGAESFAYEYVFTRVNGTATFGSLATANVFQVLGTQPLLGRTLIPADDDPGAAPVLVLSYDLWRSRMGADSGVIGKTLPIRGIPFTIVGVLPKTFQGIGSLPPDYWVPVTVESQLMGVPRNGEHLRAVIRLKPGESEAQALALLDAAMRRVAEQWADSTRGGRTELMSLANAMPSDTSETYLLFAPAMVAFALVMLIACANVANMMLARALGRQREIGVRLALGAERARLIRQMLTECVLLAVPAALLGFFLSRWTVDAGLRAMFASLPAEFAPYIRIVPLAPDVRVFVFLLIAAVVSALLFGLVPALQATRPSIVQASRGDFDTAYRPGRLRSTLLVTQITVCALLLITTGILLRGAQAVRHAETGMQTTNVVQAQVDERERAATIAKLRSHALVTQLAAGYFQPLDGMFPTVPMAYGGSNTEQVAYDLVTPNYFATLGIPVLHGRAFADADAESHAQVAIVSAATAERLWPGQDPIGQTLRIAGEVSDSSPLARVRVSRVVGVTGNTVTGWVGTGLDRLVVYYPARAEDATMHLLARVTGNEVHARATLDNDLELGPASSPIEEMHTLDDYLAVQQYPFRAFAWVSEAIGAIALLLTVAGIYGVLSYLVAQRTKEIGIRMALGAHMRNVVGLVVRETSLLALTGVAIGTVLALAMSRVFSHVLWIVDMFDVVGYTLGIGIVFVAAVLAAYAPARRAARVNPLDALRHD
jgi:predicted permease